MGLIRKLLNTSMKNGTYLLVLILIFIENNKSQENNSVKVHI